MRGSVVAGVLSTCMIAMTSACDQSSNARKAKPQTSTSVPVMEAQWTDAAAKRTQALVAEGKATYALPELRIYDSRDELIFRQTGVDGSKIVQTLNAAVRSRRALAGPSYASTIGDLKVGNQDSLDHGLRVTHAVTIFDYWASWCVPCKILERQLLSWAQKQPVGSVRVVRVEADLMKVQRASGSKTYILKQGPDGKVTKVKLN